MIEFVAVLLAVVAGMGIARLVSRSHGCHTSDDPAYSVEAIMVRIGWERIEAEPVEGYDEPVPAVDSRPTAPLWNVECAIWPGTDLDVRRGPGAVPQQMQADFRPAPVPREQQVGRHALRV
ncbi:hypothetical protein [Amycolatopsis cihanbeyliensis]|uniref:Uncharacterized protein n=1 Tax=Amycolatopsis cihanbeyliensis TaxID=1128664 RepID=A0A542DIS8_AMYCI|nr:hypothetical protein [Amycolatopsis cihanbeyliensis]TQJ02865.1 hypothetical protein FB471_2613 [Amycolatopsis cihanbeyliensis]